MKPDVLTWTGIVRLGLVQAALGAVVVLVISTLNRVMVVEYATPALIPGVLVALHYLVQMSRPRFGHGADRGGRETPWIIGGIAVLGVGAIVCSLGVILLPTQRIAAFALAVAGYLMVGLGVGAAGTTLLVLLAKRVDDARRAGAATVLWCFMIFGFALASGTAGHFLDPYSPQRLVGVIAGAASIAALLTCLATWRIEGARSGEPGETAVGRAPAHFGQALRGAWNDPRARRFTVFVFLSMLAYSAQELLLEPFAGLVFQLPVGRSAELSGLMHAGVLSGMVVVGLACSGTKRFDSLQAWTAGGCFASALALLVLATGSALAPKFPLREAVFLLGFTNGTFAVAAIASMMQLARQGKPGTEGVRMGLWGAAQALAFACGGLLATLIVDVARRLSGSPSIAYAVAFTLEGALFAFAARYAWQLRESRRVQLDLEGGLIHER